MSVEIDIACPDRTFMGYLAMPPKKVGAGVILLHEGYGLTPFIRSLADKISSRLDMFVLAPDLMWRLQPCLELKENSAEDQELAKQMISRLNINNTLEDIQATITALREVGGCTGRIGVIGLGMAGIPAFLSAARTDSDATVCYDATGLSSYLDEAIKITNPLLLHIPKTPETPSYVSEVTASLEDYMMITLHHYAETGAGFIRASSTNHNKAAAEAAERRTMEFLAANLAF